MIKNDSAITDGSLTENMSEENKLDVEGGNGDKASDQMDGFMDADDPFASESGQVRQHGISMFRCARIHIEDKRSLHNVFGILIRTQTLLMRRPLDLFH